mgnify:CR=1 FL=1
MLKPPRELFEFLRRHDADVRSLTVGLRSIVIEESAPCHEHIYADAARCVVRALQRDRSRPRGLHLHDRRLPEAREPCSSRTART